MAYPVSIRIEPQLHQKNRLTTAFRAILAIPHAILVGPGIRWSGGSEHHNSPGLLSAAAYFLAIVSWFTILFGRTHLKSIRDFSLFYLRWRTRAMAYMALFVDPYPPFGDEPYPTSIEVVEPPSERDAVSVALRLILALPHLIVLFFLFVAWFVVSIAAWVVILFTGSYPDAIYQFASGVMRWALRVETYLLLLVDEYPPFSLE
jgi:Domain of unknown function (DUF4389)